MFKPITLKEIANASGTSLRVVAEVLNGRGDGSSTVRFSEKTRDRVLKTADGLGYRPHYAASSLKSGKSFTIGHLSAFSDNHFWAAVGNGIESAADACEYDLLRMSYRDPDAIWEKAYDYLTSRRVDGLLVTCTPFNSPRVEQLLASHAPIVSVAPTFETALPSVRIDSEAGARKAAEYLIALGHRDLLWIGMGEGHSPIREAGVRKACRAAGYDPRTVRLEWVNRPYVSDVWIKRFYEQLEQRFPFDDPPTGVLCWNDDLAMALTTLLRDRGLRVPEDVSVIGFDDLSACYAWPPLTTVRHMFPEMGRKAVDELIAVIEGRTTWPEPGTTWWVEPELVVRKSTASPRSVCG